MSLLASTLSIGSLQTRCYSSGGTALKAETIIKEKKKLFKGLCCFLRPLTWLFSGERSEQGWDSSPGMQAWNSPNAPIRSLLFAILLCHRTKSVITDYNLAWTVVRLPRLQKTGWIRKIAAPPGLCRSEYHRKRRRRRFWNAVSYRLKI